VYAIENLLSSMSGTP